LQDLPHLVGEHLALLDLDEAQHGNAELVLREDLEALVVELAVLEDVAIERHVASEQDHLPIGDHVLGLFLRNLEAQLGGLAREDLARDELVHHRLFEMGFLGLQRRRLRSAACEVGEAKVLLGERGAVDLGRPVRGSILRDEAAGPRPEAQHEDGDEDAEEHIDDRAPRIATHRIEHEAKASLPGLMRAGKLARRKVTRKRRSGSRSYQTERNARVVVGKA
jgi:hypothetical protein